MSSMITLAALAGFGLVGLGLILLASLKAWQGWLDLKRLELSGAPRGTSGGSMTELIEMADLKERIRKLESIAACVDL
jgi:hypothetical protein